MLRPPPPYAGPVMVSSADVPAGPLPLSTLVYPPGTHGTQPSSALLTPRQPTMPSSAPAVVSPGIARPVPQPAPQGQAALPAFAPFVAAAQAGTSIGSGAPAAFGVPTPTRSPSAATWPAYAAPVVTAPMPAAPTSVSTASHNGSVPPAPFGAAAEPVLGSGFGPVMHAPPTSASQPTSAMIDAMIDAAAPSASHGSVAHDVSSLSGAPHGERPVAAHVPMAAASVAGAETNNCHADQ